MAGANQNLARAVLAIQPIGKGKPVKYKPTRKVRNVVEYKALKAWRNARPVTAMHILADSGTEYPARVQWLVEVIGMAETYACQFANVR